MSSSSSALLVFGAHPDNPRDAERWGSDFVGVCNYDTLPPEKRMDFNQVEALTGAGGTTSRSRERTDTHVDANAHVKAHVDAGRRSSVPSGKRAPNKGKEPAVDGGDDDTNEEAFGMCY